MPIQEKGVIDSKRRRLEEAASAIDAEALYAARSAITEDCEEWLRRSKIFSKRLETLASHDLHKFARAVFSSEVDVKAEEVHERLKNHW